MTYMLSVYSNKIGDTFTFNTAGAVGTFDVQIRWTGWANRHNDVTVQINDGLTQTAIRSVDQTANVAVWNSLGTFSFNTGANVVITSNSSAFTTNADAVRFIPQ